METSDVLDKRTTLVLPVKQALVFEFIVKYIYNDRKYTSEEKRLIEDWLVEDVRRKDLRKGAEAFRRAYDISTSEEHVQQYELQYRDLERTIKRAPFKRATSA